LFSIAPSLARARERYEAARLGPTREERSVADSGVEAAAAAVAVVAARVAKLHIRAPSDGTVALLVAAPGEAIIPAQPLMTLQKAAQHWTSFKFARGPVRRFAYGSRVELIPASGNALINARIDEIVPRGEFATWRAAGFEPLVPLATKMLIELARGISKQLGCRRSAPWDRRRSCVDSEVGPAVRIRFPPAASLVRTRHPLAAERWLGKWRKIPSPLYWLPA
jgi:hypothetical protein